MRNDAVSVVWTGMSRCISHSIFNTTPLHCAQVTVQCSHVSSTQQNAKDIPNESESKPGNAKVMSPNIYAVMEKREPIAGNAVEVEID